MAIIGTSTIKWHDPAEVPDARSCYVLGRDRHKNIVDI